MKILASSDSNDQFWRLVDGREKDMTIWLPVQRTTISHIVKYIISLCKRKVVVSKALSVPLADRNQELSEFFSS